jgi:ribosome maturation factor RimP
MALFLCLSEGSLEEADLQDFLDSEVLEIAGGLNDRVRQIIAPTIEDMGFDLVRVLVTGGRKPKLQIMVEPLEDRIMTVEDCAIISRQVSVLLDVEDPITDAYDLEVSSPGLDRPLMKLEDFQRFMGFEARAETRIPKEGQRRFKGLITKAEDDGEIVLQERDDLEHKLNFSEFAKAKLVLSDALVEAAQNGTLPTKNNDTKKNSLN